MRWQGLHQISHLIDREEEGTLLIMDLKGTKRTSNDISEDQLLALGRIIAQAVSRWFPTAAVRIRTRV
jgi:hypothetical protein